MAQDQDAQLREQWEESDEVPERDEVNRRDELDHGTAFDEVTPLMPAFSPLIGTQGSRTNRHYEIDIEAAEAVDVFVLDDYDPGEGGSLKEHMDGEFSYIPEYSRQAVQSHSAYVYVPDEEKYTLVVDYHDMHPDRRHLEDPIPVDISIEGYYYLPFEVYKERRTDG